MSKIKLTREQLDKLIDYYYYKNSDSFVEKLFDLSYDKIKQVHALTGKMKDWQEDDIIDILNYIIADKNSVNYIEVFLEEHLYLDADLVCNIFKFCEHKKDIVEFINSSIRHWYAESMYWGTVFMLFIEGYSKGQRENIISFISHLCDSELTPDYIIPYLFEFDFIENKNHG